MLAMKTDVNNVNRTATALSPQHFGEFSPLNCISEVYAAATNLRQHLPKQYILISPVNCLTSIVCENRVFISQTENTIHKVDENAYTMKFAALKPEAI